MIYLPIWLYSTDLPHLPKLYVNCISIQMLYPYSLSNMYRLHLYSIMLIKNVNVWNA